MRKYKGKLFVNDKELERSSYWGSRRLSVGTSELRKKKAAGTLALRGLGDCKQAPRDLRRRKQFSTASPTSICSLVIGLDRLDP